MCSSAFSLDVVGIYFVMLEQVFKSLAKVGSIDFPFVCYAGYSCVLQCSNIILFRQVDKHNLHQ